MGTLAPSLSCAHGACARWARRGAQANPFVGKGGAIYSEYAAGMRVLDGCAFENNTAASGGGVWWLFGNDGTECRVSNATTFLGNVPFDVATQAWSARVASAPRAGYEFESGRPVDPSDGDVPLQVFTVDIFGQRAPLDMLSTCSVLADPYGVQAPLLGGSAGTARAGVVDFSGLNVRGEIGAVFNARVSCLVNDGDVPSRGLLTVGIRPLIVGPCKKGAAPSTESQLCTACLSSVRFRTRRLTSSECSAAAAR